MARKSKAQLSGESHGTEKKVSKAQAARAAIAEGIESPKAAVAYIKERFGLDMAPQHFSATKSVLRKAGGMTVRVKRGPKPAVAKGGDAGLLMALEAMKPLVASLGAEKVKRIVDLLG